MLYLINLIDFGQFCSFWFNAINTSGQEQQQTGKAVRAGDTPVWTIPQINGFITNWKHIQLMSCYDICSLSLPLINDGSTLFQCPRKPQRCDGYYTCSFHTVTCQNFFPKEKIYIWQIFHVPTAQPTSVLSLPHERGIHFSCSEWKPEKLLLLQIFQPRDPANLFLLYPLHEQCGFMLFCCVCVFFLYTLAFRWQQRSTINCKDDLIQ